MPRSLYSRTLTTIALLSAGCSLPYAQLQVGQRSSPPVQNQPPAEPQESANYLDQQAEQELQRGTALTRSGHFSEAIPHLLTAHGRVVNEYAASMNLAICYIATDQPKPAIPILNRLRSSGHDTADVNNLLAQAYIGDSESQPGFEALQRAASMSPTNEKLYMFVADASMGKQAYALGIQVVELGLKSLPQSARLHFERAMFLSLLDRFDEAKPDFALARNLAPGSDIANLASAQQAILDGNVAETTRVAREGIKRGDEGFLLLALLGEALLRSGAAPGQPEFEEARTALEKSVAERAKYPSSQLSLGKLYLMDNRTTDAITHLEIARQLDPNNPAVYSNLAVAYRKRGDLLKAQEALETLQRLNSAQADKIRAAPEESKASYATSGSTAQHH